jgi:hypothetical protein
LPQRFELKQPDSQLASQSALILDPMDDKVSTCLRIQIRNGLARAPLRLRAHFGRGPHSSSLKVRKFAPVLSP